MTAKMIVVHGREPARKSFRKSLYLAGPLPRSHEHPNWVPDALAALEKAGYDGVVFTPLNRGTEVPASYLGQTEWEQQAMQMSDVILFWVPRDLNTLPGFTTNIEWGQKCTARNVVLGYPPGVLKMDVPKHLADKNFVQVVHTLDDLVAAGLKMLGDGADRTGGEREVPLYLWRTPSFANWLTAQKSAGNRLDGCKVELTFGVGDRKGFLLYWAAHVNIYVSAEDRNKSNELVIGRPDIMHTLGLVRNEEDLEKSQVVLVREFRSTGTSHDGFTREAPGGSGFKPVDPAVAAAKEFTQETGIPMSPDRLRPCRGGKRQVAGTTTCHSAHSFVADLRGDELEAALARQSDNIRAGVAAETEQTYVEVWTVRQLLDDPVTDLVNLGMLFLALYTPRSIN